MATGHSVTWTIRELCAGSAALSLHLLEAPSALLPYQGSKWRNRRELELVGRELGFSGRPTDVVLSDPGPWGATWGPLSTPKGVRLVASYLEALVGLDPREVYDQLQGARCPDDQVAYAAQYLYLQRLAFSGKAVGRRHGHWASAGFSRTCAYGVVGTEDFGQVKPQLPNLIRRLRKLADHLASLEPYPRVVAVQGPAPMPAGEVHRPTLVYLDPPYQGTTTYPDGHLTREGVLELALAWRAAGAAVVASEGEPLPLPGWTHRRIDKGRDNRSPFKGQQEEWLTFRGQP